MPNGTRERGRGVSLSPRPTGGSRSPSPVSLGTAGQALGASNQSVLERFGPPRLSYAQLQAVLAESERPIREWLDANVARVRGLSLAAATYEVLRALPQVADMGAGSVAGAIESWARERGITLPARSLAPHPADEAGAAVGGGGGVIDRLKRAVEAATRGTAIVEGDAGELRISVTGATARLQGGGVEARAEAGPSGVEARVEGREGSARVGTSGAAVSIRGGGVEVGARINWSGQMSFVASASDLHFNASLSADRWSLRLTFPRAQMPQDISALAGVFSDGANALSAIARETSSFRSIDQIPEIADRVSPHMAPVRRAIDAASRIARTPLGVSFGVEVGGPMRAGAAGATGAEARGVEARAVLTIRF